MKVHHEKCCHVGFAQKMLKPKGANPRKRLSLTSMGMIISAIMHMMKR